MAVERGNRELRCLLEPVQRFIRVQAEEILEPRRDLVEHPNVRARGEELVALAADDDHMDAVVETRLQDRIIQLPHHFVGVGIRRRIVELDDREPFLRAVLNERLDLRFGHGCHGIT